MSVKNILCFLTLCLALALAANPLSQQEIDTFIRGNNMIPPLATIRDFTQEQGRYIINYQNQSTTYKFVIGQDGNGNPFVVFRHQLTQINLSNPVSIQMPMMQMETPSMNFIPPHPIFQFQPIDLPLIPIPPQVGQRFQIFKLNGGFPVEEDQAQNQNSETIGNQHQNMMRGRQRHGRRFGGMMGRHGKMRMHGGMGMMNGRKGCQINEEQVKILLKDNLVIFKNAQIKQISKVGFERGSGIILSIALENEGKQFKVTAGYMPRWNKLNVMKVQENTNNQQSPLETGKLLLGKAFQQMTPVNEAPVQKQQNFAMESLIQSFIEKLLIRQSFNLPEQKQQFQAPPILVGTEGQPENPTILQIPEFVAEQPRLRGSQGEPENPVVFTPQPVENVVKPPFLLGQQGQPSNPFRFEEVKQPIINDEQEITQENSEQISELVNQVMSKLVLKKK